MKMALSSAASAASARLFFAVLNQDVTSDGRFHFSGGGGKGGGGGGRHLHKRRRLAPRAAGAVAQRGPTQGTFIYDVRTAWGGVGPKVDKGTDRLRDCDSDMRVRRLKISKNLWTSYVNSP